MDGADNRDETVFVKNLKSQLIKELDPEKIEKIVDLLEIYEPSCWKKPDMALKDFYGRYGVHVKRRTRFRRKRYILAAMLFILLLMASLSVEASVNKNIFEFMFGLGNMKVHYQNKGDIIESTTMYYSTWEKLEKELSFYILVPDYIPEGFIQDPIQMIIYGDGRSQINCNYHTDGGDEYIFFSLRTITPEMKEANMIYPDNREWTADHEDYVHGSKVIYYLHNTSEDELARAVFERRNTVYMLEGELSISELHKIIECMEEKE